MKSDQRQNVQTLQPNKIERHMSAYLYSDIVISPHVQLCLFCGSAWQWGYPLLLLFGLVGNALCLVTFAGPHLRPKTRALCCLLCTIDSFTLIIAFATR